MLFLADKAVGLDLISIDTSRRLPFFVKRAHVDRAAARGVCIEICYAAGVRDGASRRTFLSNALAVCRASRGGRNVILSSSALTGSEVRGPYDVANLGMLCGLSADGSKAAIGSRACDCLTLAATRHSHKGAVRMGHEEGEGRGGGGRGQLRRKRKREEEEEEGKEGESEEEDTGDEEEEEEEEEEEGGGFGGSFISLQ